MTHTLYICILLCAITSEVRSASWTGFRRARQDFIVTDPPPTVSTLTPTTTSSTPTITTGSSVNYTTSIPQVAPVGTVITLNPGNVYNISARNFYYGGGEILTWQFVANNCDLYLSCSCVPIPASWECLKGYLKLDTGSILHSQKFCGGNRPNDFTSDTGEIRMKYKPNKKRGSSGPDCQAACAPFGAKHQILPTVGCVA
ncbi:uncharacterized protein LOC110855283 isoform X2 [Folsomia candida]|uniref:uncharacterized protein LOC110855283 isoform X2 n=1 Tax=Folsomia candida TaxID=158441 RepID=UPI000B8F4B3F|nr:uncharacterized protein LOC110855283 isoform X2 [Folsomia candida]